MFRNPQQLTKSGHPFLHGKYSRPNRCQTKIPRCQKRVLRGRTAVLRPEVRPWCSAGITANKDGHRCLQHHLAVGMEGRNLSYLFSIRENDKVPGLLVSCRRGHHGRLYNCKDMFFRNRLLLELTDTSSGCDRFNQLHIRTFTSIMLYKFEPWQSIKPFTTLQVTHNEKTSVATHPEKAAL